MATRDHESKANKEKKDVSLPVKLSILAAFLVFIALLVIVLIDPFVEAKLWASYWWISLILAGFVLLAIILLIVEMVTNKKKITAKDENIDVVIDTTETKEDN